MTKKVQKPESNKGKDKAVNTDQVIERGKPKVDEMIIKQERKQKTTMIRIVFLGTFSFLLTVGVMYFLMALPGKADEIRLIRTQSLAYRISGQDEVLLVKSLKDSEAEREKLMNSFPTETTLLNFIRMIEGLRNVEVEVLKSSIDSDLPTKIGNSSSFLPVTLMLEGVESEVDKALNKIIDSPYFVKVLRFNKEYDLNSERVIASVQFHLYVADEF